MATGVVDRVPPAVGLVVAAFLAAGRGVEVAGRVTAVPPLGLGPVVGVDLGGATFFVEGLAGGVLRPLAGEPGVVTLVVTDEVAALAVSVK